MFSDLVFPEDRVASSFWSKTNDKETVKPLSNSPEPLKVNWLPIENVLPEFAAPPLVCSTFKLAEPATDISPAYADAATSEPAKAVKPTFLISTRIFPLNISFFIKKS